MHIYNVVVIIGFSAFVSLHYLWPGFADITGLNLGDPLLFSLGIPLLLVLAGNSVRALGSPDLGYQQMQIQIVYKPFAIILFVVFTAFGELSIWYTLLIIAGLLIYIGGNLRALRERTA